MNIQKNKIFKYIFLFFNKIFQALELKHALDVAMQQNPTLSMHELVEIALQGLPPDTPKDQIPTKCALVNLQNYNLIPKKSICRRPAHVPDQVQLGDGEVPGEGDAAQHDRLDLEGRRPHRRRPQGQGDRLQRAEKLARLARAQGHVRAF